MSPARKDDPIELTPDEVAAQSPFYCKFRDEFGKTIADEILECGKHRRDRLKLDDWFVDCLVVAIAYECFRDYSEPHGFSKELCSRIIDWIKSNVDIEPYRVTGDLMDVYKRRFEMILE